MNELVCIMDCYPQIVRMLVSWFRSRSRSRSMIPLEMLRFTYCCCCCCCCWIVSLPPSKINHIKHIILFKIQRVLNKHTHAITWYAANVNKYIISRLQLTCSSPDEWLCLEAFDFTSFVRFAQKRHLIENKTNSQFVSETGTL